MTNVQEHQDHIDDEHERVKEIYKEHFEGKEFNYNKFADIFDRGEFEFEGRTMFAKKVEGNELFR